MTEKDLVKALLFNEASPRLLVIKLKNVTEWVSMSECARVQGIYNYENYPLK